MPRRIRLWLDPFAALQNLRAFVAARGRGAGTALTSWLGRVTRRTPARKERDLRAERAALELRPMDWRNPPSENITSAVLPLAATAAAAAAAAYLVASWESQERATAAPAAERVGAGGYDAAAPVAAVTLGEPGPGGRGDEPFAPPLAGAAPVATDALGGGAAVDGAGSTLRGTFEPDLALASGAAGAGGGSGALGAPQADDRAGAAGGSDGTTAAAGPGSAGPGSAGRTGATNSAPAPGPAGIDNIPTGAAAGATGLLAAGAGRGSDGDASGVTRGTGGGGSDTGAAAPASGAGGAGGAGPAGPAAPAPGGAVGGVLLSDTAAEPVRFVQNAGQWADGIDFVARGAGYQVALARDSATVALPRAGTDPGAAPVYDAVRMDWLGVAPGAAGAGEGRLGAVTNFLGGAGPDRTGVAAFGAVRYADAWAGVDLVYRDADGRHLEYDLVVAPGADPTVPGFAVRGADARVDPSGRLVLTTPSGAELVQAAPVLYQTGADGSREAVTGGYRVRADGSIGFAVGAHDPTRALVIDPLLDYTTQFGGSVNQVGTGVAAAPDGGSYVVGWTNSTNFPATMAFDATLGGGQDAFVAKLDATGTIVWATYLGGSANDLAAGVAVDGLGRPVVAGTTNSTDFPVTAGAYRTALTGGGGGGPKGGGTNDAFLAALSADGTTLVYATYFGGTGADSGAGVALDRATGQAVLVGTTASTDLPTASAAQGAAGGSGDAFVARFTAAGSGLVYATYLGGSGAETGSGVAVDGTGAALVTGQTASSNFPTPGGYDATKGGATDAFLAQYTAAGALAAATDFGGTGDEAGLGVAVDAANRVYVAGTTTSSDLPVRNAAQAAYGGSGDGFLARFDAPGLAPEYATYQGGSGADALYAVAADGAGRAVVAGATLGSEQAVAIYAPDGGSVEWSDAPTSGLGLDAAYAVAVGPDGSVLVAGTAGGLEVTVRAYGPPPAPAIAGPGAGPTNDSTVALTGTAYPASTVSVYQKPAAGAAPVLLGTATADGSGAWSYTTPALADGAAALTATATAGGATSAPSAPVPVTVDTAPPVVTVSVLGGTGTYDTKPPIVVTGADPSGVAGPVTLNVDLNNDGDFTDPGETGFATGTASNAQMVFSGYATALPVGTVTLQVTARDLAGNVGTSPPVTVAVAPSPTTWAATALTSDARGGYAGAYGATTPADALTYAGDLTLTQALDVDMSSTCGCLDPALVLNSVESAPTDAVQVAVRSNNALGVPSAVTGTLTWDGVVSGTVSYDVSQLSPGGDWVFAAQPASGLTTGRHTYSLDLFVDYPGTGNDVTRSVASDTFLVDRSGSPYGAGWSFSATDALVTIAATGSYPAGVLRLYGKGGWSFYADVGGGAYTSPAGDAGTLVSSGGVWTYTGGDGKVQGFDSSGRMTTWVSADGSETYTFAYDGAGAGALARVATMAGPDGAVATFTYASGALSTIAAPGSRTTSFTVSSGDLVGVTNPAGDTHTFTYSAHRPTGETQRGESTAYTYANGLVRTVQVGSDPVGTVTAALGAGLGTAATAAAQGAGGSYTTPLGKTAATWYNGFGQPVLVKAADGGIASFTRDANGYVTAATDALGHTTAYTVNTRGQVTHVTQPDSTTVTAVYGGANGALSGYTDARGGVWTITSDIYGRQTAVTDPLGRTTSTSYSSGLVQTTTDPLGNVVTYLYDGARRPIGALAGGAVTGTVGYDAAGNRATFTDALGNVSTSVYDSSGRVTRVTDPLGNTTTSVYAASGLLLSVTDPAGDTTSYGYDASGRVQVEIDAYGTGLARRTTSVYDGAGNLVATVDPLGHRATSVFDAMSRVIATVDPLGNRSTTQYDLAGELVATTDPLGRVTRYGYDTMGRRVSVTDALGNTTTTVYDANSEVVATVDPLGHRSTSVYDAAGELIASVDPLGNRTSYGYDGDGRPVTVTDPLGHVTSTVYDARGRVSATIDPLGKSVTTVYDAADRAVATVDPLGNRTTTVFDTAGRTVAVIDALGNYTTAVYDGAGRMTAAVDALGNRTTTVFDALNRAVAVVDALGNRTTAVFDAADRMVASVDALGNRTTTNYDADNRAVAAEDALGNFATSVYDAAGNVVASVDALGNRTSFAVDGLDRVVATTDPLGAVSSVSYDPAGRLVTGTDPLGHVTTAVFDDANRQIAVVDALNNRSTAVFDAAGNTVATIDPLGHRTTLVFDALNRPVATIDALGNRSTVVHDDARNTVAAVDPLGHRTTTVFDALNRSVATVDALGNRTTSVFDAAGNMVASIDPLGHRSTSVYDTLNRIQATVDALGDRTTTTFDAAGNVRTTVDALNRTTTFGYDARNQSVTTTDALGNVWTTQYDALGRAWRRIDPLGRDNRTYFDAAGRTTETADGLGNRQSTVFDAAGNPVASVDPLGNRTTSVFDADNRPVAAVDALGNRATSVYDAAGNVVAQIDPLGHRSTLVYDERNRVQATVDALGHRGTAVFDAAGNLQVTIDALGRRTTATFDADNRVVATTDALGGVGTVAYDAAGNVTARTDQLNHTTSYGYDALNRVVTTTNALGQVGTTAYDAVGNTVSSTDALNHTTTAVYDALNRVVATADPLGNRATSVFDAAGQVTATVNPLGNRTSYTYDLRGLVRTVTDPLGKVTTSTYDAAGNTTAVTNARGYTTTSTYDALNRAVAMTDPLGNVTTSVFDAAGNRTATIDALGYRTTAVYDELNRQIATVDPLGHRSTTSYDAVGNVATSVDGLNQTTSYGYDALNRQVTTTDPLAFVTTSVFDAVGNQTALVDASGNRTSFAYDALNRVTTQTDPYLATTTTAYDAAGHQTSRTDALGRRRDFAFDADGRVLTEKWYATGGSLTQTQTWTYDAAGQMLTAADPDGTYTLAYDAAGRVTSAQEPFALVLTMGYDAVGNRTSVQDSKSGYTTVTFDALNRQTSEQTAGSGVSAMRFDYAYTARGQISSLTRYSNLAGSAVVGTTTYDYDAAGHETHQKATNGSGTVLANYTYTYDAADRMTAKVENGTATSYSYDTTDQLTADGATTYGYDATGNRTNTGYATTSGNRMTSDGLWTWTYDAAGNVTKRSQGASAPTWVYTYDNRDQMVSAAYSATDGGTVTQRVTYVYDAFGNRIESDSWDGTTTTVARYGEDGWDPAKPTPVGTENFDTWTDLDNTNALTVRRAFGTGVDAIIARQTSGGTVLWYLTDSQESVRQLIDNSGSVVGTLAYSAFGQVTTNSGTTDRYRFTGREVDAITRLQFNRGRIYDLVSGKWLSVDPKGFLAGDANLYRYVKNAPNNATDPSGLEEPMQLVGSFSTKYKSPTKKADLSREEYEKLINNGNLIYNPNLVKDQRPEWVDKLRLDTGCIGNLMIAMEPAEKFLDRLEKAKKGKLANDKLSEAIINEFKAKPPHLAAGVEGAWLKFEDAKALKGVKPPIGAKDQYIVFAMIGDWKDKDAPAADADGKVPADSIKFSKKDKKGKVTFEQWDFSVYQPSSKLWVNANFAVGVAGVDKQKFYVDDKVDLFPGTDGKSHDAILYFAFIVRAE